nr:hypothetical protein [Leifsonia sp. fls2-241-R2A-40a]
MSQIPRASSKRAIGRAARAAARVGAVDYAEEDRDVRDEQQWGGDEGDDREDAGNEAGAAEDVAEEQIVEDGHQALRNQESTVIDRDQAVTVGCGDERFSSTTPGTLSKRDDSEDARDADQIQRALEDP